jgi:polyferredoxin
MDAVKTRRALLFISFMLLPIIQFYFSPFISIVAALSGGIAISVVVFLTLFLVGMFFGRAPCGWIMPCGGLQEACFYANNKRFEAGRKDRIKYWIWAAWFASLITIFLLNLRRLHFDLLHMLRNGVSVSNLHGYIPYYLVTIIIFSLCMIIGKRSLCHYGCWIAPFMVFGRKLGNTLGFPGLRLKSDQSRCTGCKVCTKVCPMGIDVNNLVKSGTMEHPECILCAECSNACKADAIHMAFCRRKKDDQQTQRLNVGNPASKRSS